MVLPSYESLKKGFSDFILEEHITALSLLNPFRVFQIVKKYRFLHYLVTGSTGVLLNLFIIWLLTHFVFGLDNYFTAYLIGITLNLLYNFAVYTMVVFGTKRRHVARLCIFLLYCIVLTYIQARIIQILVPLVGLKWYLLVIGFVILAFSFISFLIFRVSLFKEIRP